MRTWTQESGSSREHWVVGRRDARNPGGAIGERRRRQGGSPERHGSHGLIDLAKRVSLIHPSLLRDDSEHGPLPEDGGRKRPKTLRMGQDQGFVAA